MAVYDLEEQEQLDELKTWWKQYGNLVTTILLAAAITAASWQGWNWWQRNQAAEASAIYAGLQQAAAQRDAKRTKELAGQLIDKFSSSAYAGMGVLVSARVQVATGDTKTARAQLTWAVEHAADEGLRDLARLRLAIILLDEKLYDDALRQLATPSAPALQARFDEVRGDILAAQGKTTDARAAYETAVKHRASAASGADGGSASPAGEAFQSVLQTKLDSLAGGAK